MTTTFALQRVAEPASEPITADEAKLWTRIGGSADDTVLARLIAAARQDAERECRRTLFTTTLELRLSAFPSWRIWLPRPRIASITHVKYYDATGTLQTLASTEYDFDAETGILQPAPTKIWPGTQPDRLAAVQVCYVAGWADVASIPSTIKQWIAVRVAQLYEYREEVVVGATVAPVPGVSGLLDEWRVRGFDAAGV